jgi:hypothetical protein
MTGCGNGYLADPPAAFLATLLTAPAAAAAAISLADCSRSCALTFSAPAAAGIWSSTPELLP